jgi:nitroreductase
VDQTRTPIAEAPELAREVSSPLSSDQLGHRVGIERVEVVPRHEIAPGRRRQASCEHECTHLLDRHGPSETDPRKRNELAAHRIRLDSEMEFFDVVKRRRMHRTFSSEPVSASDLDTLVWAGARAPQAGNAPVRRFVVVDDVRVVHTIRQVMPSFISNASAAIVVCTDLDLVARLMGERGRDVVSRIDAGTAAQTIALAATALGLGACFSQSSTEPALRAVLDLPEHVRPDIVVAVGHVANTPSLGMKMQRPPVDRNRFGAPWEAPA